VTNDLPARDGTGRREPT